jgi:MFS transporter, NNP family, nitrate/nitrite transporter
VNFWAWALLSPLGPKFKDVLHLTPIQQALVVAVPVVVGSLGRIPVGAFTDRFGGRMMFSGGARSLGANGLPPAGQVLSPI